MWKKIILKAVKDIKATENRKQTKVSFLSVHETTMPRQKTSVLSQRLFKLQTHDSSGFV